MSSEPFSQKSRVRLFLERVAQIRLLQPLVEGVLPSPRLLKGEEVQLEIRMASYRLKFAELASVVSATLLVICLFVTYAAWAFDWSPTVLFGAGMLATLMGLALIESLRHILLHEQWVFLVTNTRLILVTPDPRRRGLADAIYLMRGKIQVVDTNWSRSPWWGLFQAATGARDVLLSLTGYEFKAEGAEVKGGLLFPDVPQEDIRRLEELIFG